MRNIYLSIILLFTGLFPSSLYGQRGLSASIELSSKHVWRGLEFGTAPVVFPQVYYSAGKFSAYAMGGYAINASHQEVDFGCSYQLRNLIIGLNDYFYSSGVGNRDKYFDYSKRTGHYVEVYTHYTPDRLPISCLLSIFPYGADKLGTKQAYSSYLELQYKRSIASESDLTIALGGTFNRSFYTQYASDIALTNLTLKYTRLFRLGKIDIPLSASFIINPYTNKSFFSCSVSILNL